jgi:hypothetical protein
MPSVMGFPSFDFVAGLAGASLNRRDFSLRQRTGPHQSRPPEPGAQRVEEQADAWGGTHLTDGSEFAKCVVFQRGTSRYVFTTDVSVNEVQAFIRDLVLVLGWCTPLDRCGH